MASSLGTSAAATGLARQLAASLGRAATAGLELTVTGRPDGKAEAGDTEALRLRPPGGEEGGGSSEPVTEDSDCAEPSTLKYMRSTARKSMRMTKP
jgi:hypothetical protein